MTGNAPPANRTRILLTGFGPFPSVAQNASAELVAMLAKAAAGAFHDCEFATEVLPTEWTSGPQRFLERYAAFDPRVTLCFGVAGDATGFRIERRGANACRPALDANLDCRDTAAPVDAIVSALQAIGLPVSTSTDAGAYLCNAVYYHALESAAARRDGAVACFVHIPTDLNAGPLSLADAVTGGLEIIRVCISESKL